MTAIAAAFERAVAKSLARRPGALTAWRALGPAEQAKLLAEAIARRAAGEAAS